MGSDWLGLRATMAERGELEMVRYLHGKLRCGSSKELLAANVKGGTCGSEVVEWLLGAGRPAVGMGSR